MKYLDIVCTHVDSRLVDCFTEGQSYKIKINDGDLMGKVAGDDDPFEWRVPLDTLDINSGLVRFELVEESPAFSSEYEEEELQRLEKKLEQCQQTQEVYCDVALAYQLSQIQKFLRDSGADIELVVHKDFIAISDENCKEYRGNVEQILRYVKVSGELAKVADEMDRTRRK